MASSLGPLTFAQRRVYGRYIAELVTPHLGLPGEPGRLRIIYGQGRTIATTPTSVTIGIDDGSSITGTLPSLPPDTTKRRKTAPVATSIPGRARLIQAWIVTRLS